MKQTTYSSTGFELVTRRTHKLEFLEEKNPFVPWTVLAGLIRPLSPASKTVVSLFDKLEKVKDIIWANVENPSG
jgi:hypothetical protein